MDRWVGKVALVTGASAGIGAAIVEELAKHGMKVVGLARRAEKVEDIKKRVGKVKGKIHALKGDVSKEEDIVAAFKWIKDKFGAIHVLVNNAGVVHQGLTLESNTDLFREVLDTNVLGLTICTQQAYKLMKEAAVDDGHIIHINAVLGHQVLNISPRHFNMYPASKFAVTALTETLRQELNFLKSNIRVTSISPGLVKSGFDEATSGNDGAQFKDFYKALPGLQSQDIADSVVYVLSTSPRVQIHELTLRANGEPF